jgi:hypothetical protein
MNNIKINTKINLIGEPNHQSFLELQAAYGIAQRGGTAIVSSVQAKRLSSDINVLNTAELKTLIFNETIFSN